jgi:CTP synthase
MADQKKLLKEKDYGGTMRLGSYKCALQKGTKAYNAYGKKNIEERHRHRYEFNNQYHKLLKEKGIVFAGKNPKRDLVEIIELKNHPFFIGVQFHPELKSRPLNPHPLFKKFIKASIK